MNEKKAVLRKLQNGVSNGTRNDGCDKLRSLMEHLKALQEQKFTGHIKINFSQGGIGRVEKFEEISRILEP